MTLVSTSQAVGSDGRVAVIRLDRADAGNALSRALCTELRTALEEVDRETRVVVLCSSARDFCVGADLRERRGLDDEALLEAREVAVALTNTLVAYPLPVVAAVHGFALGGGLELALAADVIVADASAILGLPEAGIGIIPGAGGTQLLARRVGWGAASELALTGRRVDAEEARLLRLVDHVVDTGGATRAAQRVAATIAANNPRSLRLIKASMRDGSGMAIPDALAVEDAAWREAALSPDYREGLAAFAEKRPAQWVERHPS